MTRGVPVLWLPTVALAVLMILLGVNLVSHVAMASAAVPSTISCYSGGHEIYRGRGIQVERLENSYVYFQEVGTGRDISIRADCMITK